MNNKAVLFLALLRNALWQTAEDFPAKLAPETSRAILRMAEEQTVMGLVVDALIRNNIRMEQQVVFEAFGMLEQIKETNRKVNKELLEILLAGPPKEVGMIIPRLVELNLKLIFAKHQ